MDERQEKMQQLLAEQAALEETVAATTQMLRFALDISHQNLSVIRDKLLAINNISGRISAEPVPPPQDDKVEAG